MFLSIELKLCLQRSFCNRVFNIIPPHLLGTVCQVRFYATMVFVTRLSHILLGTLAGIMATSYPNSRTNVLRYNPWMPQRMEDVLLRLAGYGLTQPASGTFTIY